MKLPFQIEPNILTDVYEKYLEAIANVPADQESAPQLDQKIVGEIIQKVFWASLTKEESRTHYFSVAIHPPRESSFLRPAYQFEFPVGLEKLPKLASAVDHKEWQIGVWADNNEQPYIWGMGKSFINCLVVKVFEPSEIILSFSGEKGGLEYLIDKTRASEITFLSTWFYAVKPFYQNAVEQEPDEGKKSRQMDAYLSLLVRLVKNIRQHNHGGILLFVEEADEWRESIRFPIPFAAAEDGFEFIKSPSEIEIKVDSSIKKNLAKLKDAFITDRVELISQLTAVDGATILRFSLDVVAFGAKIKPRHPDNFPRSVVVNEPLRDIEETEKIISDLGGTRHQSVVQFAYDQPNSFAIVVSQDGRISLVFWDETDKQVRIIQHAEYWFFTI